MRDFEIISEELRLKDEENLDKLLEKMERTVIRGNDKKLKPEYVSQGEFPINVFQNHIKCFNLYS